MQSDAELLAEYAARQSEAAFAQLVERHVALVHSAALRQVGDPHLAKEITQAVFIILAHKAGSLGGKTVLAGWLCRTAHFAARDALKIDRRRQQRDHNAYLEFTMNPNDADTQAAWQQLAPQLDGVVAQLNDGDRAALVLRYYERRPLDAVGAALGIGADAAQKRVTRALEKLRRLFAKRGVTLTAALIAGAVSANSVQAAPATLAKVATTIAVAKGVTASSSTLTLINGALKLMVWTKAKMAVIVSAVVLLAAGTTTVTINTIRERTTYPWQTPRVQSGMLERVPAQVRIVPSKFSEFGGWGYDRRDGNRKVIGIGAPVKEILQAAYGTLTSRTVFPSALPKERYDFIANLPTGSEQALQKEIERKFSFVGRKVIRQTDVLILTIKNSHAPGLKPTAGRGSPDDSVIGPGQCSIPNQPLSGLAELLESYFEVPVIDRSRIASRFDIDLIWDEQAFRENPEGLKQALLDELGLELAPGSEPIEMLVVDKTK